MVKVIVGIMFVVGVVIVGAYYFGGVGSFDPTAQGRKAKAAITPGLTWTQVVSAAGAPRKYQVMQKVKDTMFGQEVETLKPGPVFNFDAVELTRAVNGGDVADGFIFRYMFSSQAAFQVFFDGQGLVLDVEDVPTVANLLDTRE